MAKGNSTQTEKNPRALKKVVHLKNSLPPHVAELLSIAKTMSNEGQHILLGRAQELAAEQGRAKANPAKIIPFQKPIGNESGK